MSNCCNADCGWCGACTSGPRLNATCSDCHEDFHKGRDDVGNLCDACCARRDAHTDALQLRMAKAQRKARAAVDRSDVA